MDQSMDIGFPSSEKSMVDVEQRKRPHPRRASFSGTLPSNSRLGDSQKLSSSTLGSGSALDQTSVRSTSKDEKQVSQSASTSNIPTKQDLNEDSSHHTTEQEYGEEHNLKIAQQTSNSPNDMDSGFKSLGESSKQLDQLRRPPPRRVSISSSSPNLQLKKDDYEERTHFSS